MTGQKKTSRRSKYIRRKTGAGWGDKEEDRERKREEKRTKTTGERQCRRSGKMMMRTIGG